jgi:hypothetical protein
MNCKFLPTNFFMKTLGLDPDPDTVSMDPKHCYGVRYVRFQTI